LGLDREKVFSPEKVIKQKTRRSRLPFDDFCLALRWSGTCASAAETDPPSLKLSISPCQPRV